jgi:hypothetical protein
MTQNASPDLPAVPPQWNQHRVAVDSSTTSAIQLFQNSLNDAADEAPLKTYLASHPQLLTCLLPPGRDAWCWDRPRFGSELIPDFLLSTSNSTGFEWVMIELESPTVRPLIQSGLPGTKLREAEGQFQDWRIWLRPNIAYAQNQLGFAGLTAEARAVIVIGRRSGIERRHAKRWRELTSNDTRVMTYDRLVDTCRTGRTRNGGIYG